MGDASSIGDASADPGDLQPLSQVARPASRWDNAGKMAG